ncbi:MAG: hypothetical protein ACFHX7_12355 [Pseudomonadota bacterium]
MLVVGCGNDDECVAETAQIEALQAIVAMHQATFESRSAEAVGQRANSEILAILAQRDDNIRAAQQAEVSRLEEKLLALLEEQKQVQAGDAAAAAAKQAELDAAMQEAEQLRANLDAYRANQEVVESRLEGLREVDLDVLTDPNVFPKPETSDGTPVGDSPEQDMIGMMMVAGVCYAASGGLCGLVAAKFLQSFTGGTTTDEDIEKMGSIIDKASKGEDLSYAEKQWLRKQTGELFDGNENVTGILADVLSGSRTPEEGFEEAIRDAMDDKLGAGSMEQLERLINQDVSCADVKELLNGVDPNTRNNINQVLPILQKRLATTEPEAAECLRSIDA